MAVAAGARLWRPVALLLLLLCCCASISRSLLCVGLAQQQMPPVCRAWAGLHGPLPVYPPADCATECSHSLASAMRACAGDSTLGIPATTCKEVPGNDTTGVCPTKRYPDAFMVEGYCLPRFDRDCSHPDNYGCAGRCALYQIINHHCVADAFDPTTKTFNKDCIFCNMCWDKSRPARDSNNGSNSAAAAAAARRVPFVLLQARGPSGALFLNHWLVLPKAACSGIESPAAGCTDAAGEHLWASAYHQALQLGFSYSDGPPRFALNINAPNRRGVHQLHIHIAPFDERRSAPSVDRDAWLVRRLAAAAHISQSPAAPTQIRGEGFYDPLIFAGGCSPLGRPPKDWARAYAVFVPTDRPVDDLGRSIKPFDLGRRLSAASDLPGHSYGLLLMPRKFGDQSGLIIAITWSTDDWEQLDVTEMTGDPIGFSHTCHNYIPSIYAAALDKS